MKRIFIIFIFLFPLLITAQDYSNAWKEFFSYYHIKGLAYGNNKIYAAAENAVFVTDVGSFEQKNISTLNGLSGEAISAIFYLDEDNSLLIGYENGLIQLYDFNTKKVKTFIDIKQKPTITPDQKQINGFYKYNNRIYISTNYGITEYTPSAREFGDTYFIGDGGDQLAVNAACVFNGKLFAATQGGGIRFADIDNSDIVDYNEWSQIGSGIYKAIVVFNNKLYALNSINSLERVTNGTTGLIYQFQQNVNHLAVNAHYLTAALMDKTIVLNEQFNQVASFSSNEIDAKYTAGVTLENGELFMGNETYGLIVSSVNNPTNYDYYSPNGPLKNNAFSLDVSSGNLWVVFGERNYYYNPYPLKKRGISHHTEEGWVNLPYSELPEMQSIINVNINPNHPDQVFFCSYHDGIMEVNNDEIVNYYTPLNSNLENASGGSNEIRIGPSTFDTEGNIWFANALSEDGLIKFTPGESANSFAKYDMSDIISNAENNNGFGEIISDHNGNIYMASYQDGVVGYSSSKHKFAKVKGGEGQGNLPNNYIRTLALDNNNQLWIGGRGGLRVLYNPENMFSTPNISARNIVFLDDQGVAQELFAGLTITFIAVDGNNNKWVGSTAGVYYVSSDGQKTIYHFTTENSPLPSNNVNVVKIDGETGLVYIGTDKGLVAFRGKSTDAQDDLTHLRAFPNPVRPGYEGAVTIDGLMKDANVKITDVEGNLVYEEVSKGGSIQWDTRAFGKYKVASGVYFVMVSAEKGATTKIAKIMIIR